MHHTSWYPALWSPRFFAFFAVFFHRNQQKGTSGNGCFQEEHIHPSCAFSRLPGCVSLPPTMARRFGDLAPLPDPGKKYSEPVYGIGCGSQSHKRLSKGQLEMLNIVLETPARARLFFIMAVFSHNYRRKNHVPRIRGISFHASCTTPPSARFCWGKKS